MKKFIAICLTLLVSTSLYLMPVQAITANKQKLNLECDAAVLMDMTSGMVLYQKNATKSEFPASITKIMTVYLAAANLKLTDTLVASHTAIDNFDRTSTHIWLDYDEELSVEDAIMATYLQSANDTSNVLAEAVSGTQEEFAALMTKTAKSFGANSTTFKNAHGLPDEEHVTTAYDMAMIAKGALKDSAFRKIWETFSYTMNPTNKQKDSRVFSTGVALRKRGEFNYEACTGGKIGYTSTAGYTMITTAEKNGMELICVVLGCPTGDSRFTDTIKLFDYGFSSYRNDVILADSQPPVEYTIMSKDQIWAECKFTLPGDLTILMDAEDAEGSMKLGYDLRDKESPDTINCVAQLSLHGSVLTEIPMKADIQVNDLSENGIGAWIRNTLLKTAKIVGIILIVFVAYTILVIVNPKFRIKVKKKVVVKR